MSKPKILIIGGGIGGLSCATSLAETGEFDISIYESDIIGGQASSQNSKLCNTEISWRVFGSSYKNLLKIIKDIDTIDKFYISINDDNCYDNNSKFSLGLIETLKHMNKEIYKKILPLFFMCRERLINNYHNITADEYFDKNNFIRLLVGPYSGLEATKVTLSGTIKFLLSTLYGRGMPYLTKYPTSDSLFEPWKKYLKSLGVKIYENYELNEIITENNCKIKKLIINDNIYTGDEIIFACSLKPLISIFNNNLYLKNTNIKKKINILENGEQIYISVNFYWKRPIIKSRTCHSYTFTNGWMPIILKRFINTDYIDKECNKNIKEVWNIGVADYLIGNYIKKYTSECSYEEIVYEIKMNILNSEHFKNYFDFENNIWEDYFYDYEFDDRYYKKLPSTKKFSINKNIEENLLNNQEPELGNNIYFSAYYVKNTTGGASMETSCEIGLTTSDLICKKYNIDNPRKPIYKNVQYFFLFFIPFVFVDYLLYKLKIKPISYFINPLILIIFYLLFIFIILYKVLISFFKNRNIKKFIKRMLNRLKK